MTTPPIRGPEDAAWRRSVLDALDLATVWGLDPITAASWGARYRPGRGTVCVLRAWERMKAAVRRVGVELVSCWSAPQGSTDRMAHVVLTPAGLARIRQLGRELDTWLLERERARQRRRRRERERIRRAKTRLRTRLALQRLRLKGRPGRPRKAAAA